MDQVEINPIKLVMEFKNEKIILAQDIVYTLPIYNKDKFDVVDMENISKCILTDGFGKEWDLLKQNKAQITYMTFYEWNKLMQQADFITYRHAIEWKMTEEEAYKSRLWYNKCFSALLEVEQDFENVVNFIKKDNFLFYEGTKENAWDNWDKLWYSQNIKSEDGKINAEMYNSIKWDRIHRNACLNDNYQETEYGIVLVF